jgi:hypothetical protein
LAQTIAGTAAHSHCAAAQLTHHLLLLLLLPCQLHDQQSDCQPQTKGCYYCQQALAALACL